MKILHTMTAASRFVSGGSAKPRQAPQHTLRGQTQVMSWRLAGEESLAWLTVSKLHFYAVSFCVEHNLLKRVNELQKVTNL